MVMLIWSLSHWKKANSSDLISGGVDRVHLLVNHLNCLWRGSRNIATDLEAVPLLLSSIRSAETVCARGISRPAARTVRLSGTVYWHTLRETPIRLQDFGEGGGRLPRWPAAMLDRGCARRPGEILPGHGVVAAGSSVLEALTHPYLARAWAKSRTCACRRQKVAMLVSLDHVARQHRPYQSYQTQQRLRGAFRTARLSLRPGARQVTQTGRACRRQRADARAYVDRMPQ